MATVESAAGPRYAPDDPTLPKPWKGLIDGSTLYYWNPETNTTQYERPASSAPPLPPGPPPATTSQLASVTVAQGQQPNGMVSQSGQQMTQGHHALAQQQVPLGNQLAQQQSSLMGQVNHQQGSQTSQVAPQQVGQFGQQVLPHGHYPPHHHYGTQMMQNPPFQMVSQAGQQIQQQHPHQLPQQMPQQSGQHLPPEAIQQVAPQFGRRTLTNPGSQMAQPHTNQFQQPQPMGYQQNFPLQKPDSSPQVQNSTHGQPFQIQQDFRPVFPRKEEVEYKQSNHPVGYSPSQFQHGGSSSSQNIPGGSSSSQMPPTGAYPGQVQQPGSYQVDMQHKNSPGQLHQSGNDLANQSHGPKFSIQMGPSMMLAQQSNMPPAGLRLGHEDNLHGRPGNEYLYNVSKDGAMASPQQPRIAQIPIGRKQADMMMGAMQFQNVGPGPAGGLNSLPSHGMQNMYSHGGVAPFPNNASMRIPHGVLLDPSLSATEAYCQQHEVTATGDNVPAPFMTFEATGFPPEILREIHSAGFSAPTPIQAQTWPIALQGKDIVAIAKTGSGKTLGYLMPAFMLLRMRRNNPQHGPTVLVLSPTRELATQIQDEAIKFGRSSRFVCTCLYGGAPKGPQLKELERGADIVVATPGRLNDILEMKQIDFRQVSLLVLDEADRMLDMGFEPQIRKIVNEIPPRRQTLMYTATWPKEVRKIAADLLVNPVQVNIGNVDELAANKSITQYVELVPQMEKQRRLEQILRSQERGSKVIIFCSTKRLCDQLTRGIGRSFGAVAIHGDKSQGERDWALNQFRSGKNPILVATDVAARGLDVKDIRIVINYDFPTGVEDYVHRIGRTGRAGATGIAYTFFCDQDRKYAPDLIKVLEGANQHVPPEIRDMASQGGSGFSKDRGGGRGGGRFDPSGGPAGGTRWDSGGGGIGFGGRGGGRDGGGFFSGGRGRDGGRGGMRDGGGFGGRGGGMRDGGFGVRGGRSDFFSGGGRGIGGGRGFGDRFNSVDGGRSGGGGRGIRGGRFGSRSGDRGRGRSRSPDMVRTWSSRSRSRSRSRGRSRSWSRSRSRSRSRSWSRGGRSRSYSRSPSRNRSRSRSYERPPRVSKFDQRDPAVSGFDAPLEVVRPSLAVEATESGRSSAVSDPPVVCGDDVGQQSGPVEGTNMFSAPS